MTTEGIAVGDDVGVTSRIVAWDAEVMFKPLKLFRDVKNAPLSKAVRSLDFTALCVMLLVMFKSYKTFTPARCLRPFIKVACTLLWRAEGVFIVGGRVSTCARERLFVQKKAIFFAMDKKCFPSDQMLQISWRCPHL